MADTATALRGAYTICKGGHNPWAGHLRRKRTHGKIERKKPELEKRPTQLLYTGIKKSGQGPNHNRTRLATHGIAQRERKK